MIRMGGFVIKKIPPFNSPLPIWSFLVLAAINKQYNNNNNNNQKTFLSNLTNLRQLISTFHSQPTNQKKHTTKFLFITTRHCAALLLFLLLFYICAFLFLSRRFLFLSVKMLWLAIVELMRKKKQKKKKKHKQQQP